MGILPTKYMILDGRTLESQDVFTRTVLTSTSSIIYKKVKSKLEAHVSIVLHTLQALGDLAIALTTKENAV